MKITNVEGLVLRAELDKPWALAGVEYTHTYATLVKITTSSGQVGYGECLVRSNPRATKDIVEELGEMLQGKEVFDIAGHIKSLWSLMRTRGHSKGFVIEALSGIDIALWDLMGKHAGLPIYRVAAGMGRSEIPVYASSIFFGDNAHVQREGMRLKQSGFDSIKIKTGRGVSHDLAQVELLRETVGGDVQILVDANCAYDYLDALTYGQELHKLDVFWLEEPVMPDNIAAYSRLNEELPLHIVAGEAEYLTQGFKPLFDAKAINIAQPDAARAGGISELRKIAELADLYGLRVAPHTGASGGICMLAGLHASALIPNLWRYEYMILNQPLQDLFKEPFPVPEKSMVRLPEAPGLGLEVDPEKIERYRIA